jgi:protein YibB
MSSDITIVTAFFDIGRGTWPSVVRGHVLPPYQHRTNETYLSYFNLLASIDNPMIIFTEFKFIEMIKKIREDHGHADKTKIIAYPDGEVFSAHDKENLLKDINETMNSDSFISKVNEPWLPEYWNSKYVMINFMKSDFVVAALPSVETPLVAWIDFGYCRTGQSLPVSGKWQYDFDPNKIHFFNQYPIAHNRNIEDIIRTGDVYIQGCHIVGGKEAWKKLKSSVYKNVDKLLEMNYIDDDQTLLLMSYLDDEKKFELHRADPNDWFMIFKRYNTL